MFSVLTKPDLALRAKGQFVRRAWQQVHLGCAGGIRNREPSQTWTCPLKGLPSPTSKGIINAIGDGGAIATAEPIHTRCLPPPGAPWIAAVSRSHGDARTEAFIDGRPGAVRLKLGSAVKLGRVAEGAADIYPRLAPTSEWDIAAGHAVVTAAGGRITDAQGADVQFGRGRADFIVPEFIAWGDPSAAG